MNSLASRKRVLYLTAWNVAAVHEGIVAYAHKAGWILDNSMCYTAKIPVGMPADGIICRHSYSPEIINFTRSLDVPVIAFERSASLPVPRVYFDEEAIGAMAARHLLARGFKQLCFLHLGFTPHQMPRMTGFRREAEAAEARFREIRPASKPASWHEPPGEAWSWLRDALEPLAAPIGIMATNDQIARPVIDALSHMGFHIPTQVAVVSAENDPMICDIAAVSISSVEANAWQMGYEAAHRLDRMMDGETPEEETLLIPPSHVRVRESSDALAVGNAHVADALHDIWQHYAEPIMVEHVADGVRVTRRHLQTLFHRELGRTMQDELARVRTARACFLLKTTSLKVSHVATLSGFNSALHLHRTLQSSLGMGPRAFRDQGQMPDLGALPASVDQPV